MKIHVHIDRIVVDHDVFPQQSVTAFQQGLEESLQAKLTGHPAAPGLGALPIGWESHREQALSPQALGHETAQRIYQEIADGIGESF